MSTLHKVKQYFGMVPLEEYDDQYLDVKTPEPRAHASRRRTLDDEYDSYEGEYRSGYRADRPYPYEGRRDEAYEDYAREGEYAREPGYGYDERYREPAPVPRPARLEPLRADTHRPALSTRGALAVDPRTEVVAENSALSRIVSLQPESYEDARTIGEKYREGAPVIMDLTGMDNADAKRLVDFAAGLAFALHGSFDRIAKKVFMLSTADIDVTAEERARIVETGFYSQ
ncbi:cell division protein SepF [Tsukamurella soli]|uniref:Cell division protein SepF n=1 Tax=Tsukamurella soli TaxID=644556 RepID=A0ABP8K380_9ACTN